MTQHDVEKIGRTLLPESEPQRDVEAFARRDENEEALLVHSRLMELEAEHLRLQRLVAELLIKNQKLRALHYDHAGSSASTAATACGRHDPSIERMQMERVQPSPR